MPNTIDQLMAKDPLELSAQDIDEIIAYARKNRALWDSGAKPKKKGEGPPISLESLGMLQKAPEIKRRKIIG